MPVLRDQRSIKKKSICFCLSLLFSQCMLVTFRAYIEITQKATDLNNIPEEFMFWWDNLPELAVKYMLVSPPQRIREYMVIKSVRLFFQGHMKSGRHVNFIRNSVSLGMYVEDVDLRKAIKKF